MKAYTTFDGAKRAAQADGQDRPILRLLADPLELFIVLPNRTTQLMAVVSSDGICTGSTRYCDLV